MKSLLPLCLARLLRCVCVLCIYIMIGLTYLLWGLRARVVTSDSARRYDLRVSSIGHVAHARTAPATQAGLMGLNRAYLHMPTPWQAGWGLSGPARSRVPRGSVRDTWQ